MRNIDSFASPFTYVNPLYPHVHSLVFLFPPSKAFGSSRLEYSRPSVAHLPRIFLTCPFELCWMFYIFLENPTWRSGVIVSYPFIFSGCLIRLLFTHVLGSDFLEFGCLQGRCIAWRFPVWGHAPTELGRIISCVLKEQIQRRVEDRDVAGDVQYG